MKLRPLALGVIGGSILGLAAVHTAAHAAGSVEVPVTATAQDNTEPSIAVNPTNTQNIVIAYMFHAKGIDTWLGIATSFNGGSTWSNQYLPFTGTPANVASINVDPTADSTFADPNVVFDSAGIVYVSGLAYNHTFEYGAVLVSHSADGGVTWSAPAVAIQGTTDCGPDNCIDRPWLAVGAQSGRLYLVAQTIFVNDALDLLSHEFFTTSSDGGATWSAVRTVDTASYSADTLPEATLTVTPGGVVAIAYNASGVPEGIPCPCIAVATTADNGATFTYHTVTTATEANYGVNLGDQGEPQIDGQPDAYRFALAPTIVADPAVNGRLVIARLSFPGTVPYDVQKQGQIQATEFESDDTGATWSAPVVVQQSSTTNSDRVWIGYNAAGQLGLDVRSHQGRCCNTAYEIWAATSAGDINFNQPLQVSNPGQEFADAGAAGGQGLGDDFIGYALAPASMDAVWMGIDPSITSTTSSSGVKEIYFASVALDPPPSLAEAPVPLLFAGIGGGAAIVPAALRRRWRNAP